MPLYIYTKQSHTPLRRFVSFVSLTCMLLGASLLVWVLYPILSFEIAYAAKFESLLRPIPPEPIAQSIGTTTAAVLGNQNADYTKASIWFPHAVSIRLAHSNTSYLLSIPKLGILDASVLLGSEDLNKSLIHFTGPLPGNLGNPVIFGHSTIPWLYNPKDYTSIFSKLPDLSEGDEIFVVADHIRYRYVVTSMHVTTPQDVSVLNQQYDAEHITLVTCVPPGTYFKRLIVQGKLVSI